MLSAIKQYLSKISCGFTLNIFSEFDSSIGHGSSAAVVVATLGALTLWLEGNLIDYFKLYNLAIDAIR